MIHEGTVMNEKLRKKYIPMSETMTYILFALREERHGYGVMLYTKELTGGRIALGAGTVYQTLGKLEKDKLIAFTRKEERKKYYVITEDGGALLEEEVRRIKNIFKDMGGLI